MNKQQMVDSIAWDIVMQCPRYAGGHTEVMDAIFLDAAIVIDSHIDDDYQGDVAYAYEFKDGTVAIIVDSFGSCCGCDSWECATDEEARVMVHNLAANSRLFSSREEAQRWCKEVAGTGEHYLYKAAKNLNLYNEFVSGEEH